MLNILRLIQQNKSLSLYTAAWVIGLGILAAWVYTVVPRYNEEQKIATENREQRRLASQGWHECSSAAIQKRLQKELAPTDLQKLVIDDCQREYQKYQELTSPTAKDMALTDAALLKVIERAKEEKYPDEREKRRRHSLIEEAIERLAEQGVSREDLIDYLEDEFECDCEQQ